MWRHLYRLKLFLKSNEHCFYINSAKQNAFSILIYFRHIYKTSEMHKHYRKIHLMKISNFPPIIRNTVFGIRTNGHKIIRARFLFSYFDTLSNQNKVFINVREYRRGNQKWTIQISWQHMHNTICVGYHCVYININNVNKIWALLQTTGGKDEPTIVTNITTRNAERTHNRII